MGQYPYETLFNSKWLEVRKAEMGDLGSYIYSHSPWSNSNGVAILAYRDSWVDSFFQQEVGNDGEQLIAEVPILTREFLGRYEICPAHNDEFELCSITGGCDKEGERPKDTAIRELEEEGGIRVLHKKDVVYLGIVRPSKASDSTMYLFCIKIEERNHQEVEAKGDGTLGEEGTFCKWVSSADYIMCKDPLVHTMMLRLQQISL